MSYERFDTVVIGAGFFGCLAARELTRYSGSVCVVERESDVGEGASKANSGVLYAGFHARGGSLKGISCAEGNRMHAQLCKELDVPMKKIGSLFVAFHDEGLESIADKMKKGKKNGVPGMKMISGDEARAIEPLLSKRVIGAMYAPTTGIISPFLFVLNAARCAERNGAQFRFNTEISHIERLDDSSTIFTGTDAGTAKTQSGGYRLITNGGDVIEADYVVNASGEGAAAIESLVRARDLDIKPKRGEYLVFDAPAPISHVVYQASEHDEKGTLIAPATDGNMLVGPTSYEAKTFYSTETTRRGHDHLRRVIAKILPGYDLGCVIASFAGIRANITNIPKEEKDFIVRLSAPCFVSALGIKNPGMTAAPYLVRMMLGLLADEGLPTELRSGYEPVYRSAPKYLTLGTARQQKLFRQDPAYGRVVCRCEQVTEGDILAVLKEPLPPRDMNGLKKRLRTGMGNCQGSYCIPQVIELLSREWKTPPERILKCGAGSSYIKGTLR